MKVVVICFFCSMTVAMKAQPKWEVMDRTDVFYAGVALMVLGTVLVVVSFLALGFTGTFLGGYQTQCQILKWQSTDFTCECFLVTGISTHSVKIVV